jgi:hypothetical protein
MGLLDDAYYTITLLQAIKQIFPDDAYYTITLLQAIKQIFPESGILPELDLNYARRIFIGIIGMDLVRRIETRAFGDLDRLMQQKQDELINNISSIRASNVGDHLDRVTPYSSSNEYSTFNSAEPSDWYEFQSSGYEPRDQFYEDSAGWSGGAPQNPSSNWYSPDDDY